MLELKSVTALDQFRLAVSHKPEIIEELITTDNICFSVQKGVAVGSTYDSAWAQEARGIVFNADTGAVAGRPLHKFFNVNEREETLAYKLNWATTVRVMDKRDGSMIHTVATSKHERFYLKSKKKHDSDVALAATQWMLNEPGTNIFNFCNNIVALGLTAIFEFTSPNNRIVLGYSEPKLVLLHLRENISGRYLSMTEMEALTISHNIPIVDSVTEFNSFEEMLEAAKTREGIEGWVIQFTDGDMVKIKTEWYMARHRAMTFYRERDIAELILAEQMDDITAMLRGDGIDVTPIEKIEQKFKEEMVGLINIVNDLHEQNKHLTPKDAAAKFKGDDLFGLILAKFNNKRPDFERHFRKYILKQKFGLASLGSLTPEGTHIESPH